MINHEQVRAKIKMGKRPNSWKLPCLREGYIKSKPEENQRVQYHKARGREFLDGKQVFSEPKCHCMCKP